jgi:tRNA 2-thiouridine synthesizing protein A
MAAISAEATLPTQGLGLPRIGADRMNGRPARRRNDPDMAETILNLRGLKCPLPALKARKALAKLAVGDMLVLECTDPLSTIDIPNLLRETGDVLEASAKQQALFVFRIRKAGQS